MLHELRDGSSNGEIGRRLFIAEDTVKTHVRDMLKALGARTRTEAVALAYEAGVFISVVQSPDVARSQRECMAALGAIQQVEALLLEAANANPARARDRMTQARQRLTLAREALARAERGFTGG